MFLEQVIEDYLKNYADVPTENLILVTPHRRSALFLREIFAKKYRKAGKPYQHQVFLFRHCAADFPAAAQMRDEFVQLPQGVFVGGVLFVFCHMDSVSHRQ